MKKTKVAVTVTMDAMTLIRVDRLVREARCLNRSQAIEAAVNETLDRMDRRRLAEACAKLDPAAERDRAEEGIIIDAGAWPEY